MIFTKQELKEIPTSISDDDMLSIEDLLVDFAVTSENKVLFPIARVEYKGINPQSGEYEISLQPIYTLKELRDIKISLDTIHRSRLITPNREKYILGNENVSSNFKHYGWKNLKNSEDCRKDNELQQQYLIDNNYKQIIVSHTDCGYEYRGGDESYRDMIADYICDGTNDTEILQQAIDSNPGENIEIMLLEDEYVVRPTSGSGTADDPYICLNIDRNNVIIRSCDRKTNLTVDRSIVKDDDVCYIIAVRGKNVDISNVHFGLDELDIHYVEYKYPTPTEKMIEVKNYVEGFDPFEKIFSKAEVLKLMKNEEEN